MTQASTLITIATYNEIDNLPRLVDEIFRVLDEADWPVEVLVIDDHSPDGTGDWCDRRAAEDERVHVMHREGKLGLGTATIAAMQYAIEHDYQYHLNLDADFSHHPRYLPAMLSGMTPTDGNAPVDVMIGSRYVPGGGTEGWPWRRRMMSKAVNLYARCLLGLKPKDCSGAFRCFRVDMLRKLSFETIRSTGYSFQEEILWKLKRAGARMAETPIVFADREFGESKIDSKEAYSALWVLFRCGIENWTGV